MSLGITKFVVIFLLMSVWLILTVGFPLTTKWPSGFYPADLAVWAFGSALFLIVPFKLVFYRYRRRFPQAFPLRWKEKAELLFYLLSFYLGVALLGMCIPAYHKNPGQWGGLFFFGALGLALVIQTIRAFIRHVPEPWSRFPTRELTRTPRL